MQSFSTFSGSRSFFHGRCIAFKDRRASSNGFKAFLEASIPSPLNFFAIPQIASSPANAFRAAIVDERVVVGACHDRAKLCIQVAVVEVVTLSRHLLAGTLPDRVRGVGLLVLRRSSLLFLAHRSRRLLVFVR